MATMSYKSNRIVLIFLLAALTSYIIVRDFKKKQYSKKIEIENKTAKQSDLKSHKIE